jgi:hypothetical protein
MLALAKFLEILNQQCAIFRDDWFFAMTLRTYLWAFVGFHFYDQYLPQFNAIFSKFPSTTQRDLVSIDFVANLLCKMPNFSSFLHKFDFAVACARAGSRATPDGHAQIFDFIVQKVEKVL